MKTIVINELLGMSQIAYQNNCNRLFNYWCELHAERCNLPERLLQTDTKLHDWWLQEYCKQVNLFIDDAKDFHAENVQDSEAYQELFSHYLNQLFSIYPSAILNKIKNEYKKPNRSPKTVVRRQ